ncbi:hypothetical protein OSB04_008962 [Centaurea solstitialis]|uniref:Uncharacterized protein n=1 Tax=Centaurea solstitialis TaxID=347529 RepID=A0AA38U637_9ASTR|nr:hypothetical protein OSB04_008962 [Centaurea solstitialis]
MDSLLNTIKTAAAGTTTSDDPKKANPAGHPSASKLMASAKLVAESAKYATSNQSEKIDKPKAAGAAADILDAIEKYGKFDETKGIGQYLQKAEDYLHNYEKSGTAAPAPAPAKEKKKEGGSGFGAGDALKAAGIWAFKCGYTRGGHPARLRSETGQGPVKDRWLRHGYDI